MRLSRRDDDLLHLVNHGVRSALEERILRGRLVTAGLKILPGQIADNPEDNAEFNNIAKQEKRAMLARAYRIVHASVGDTVTKLEIERLFGQLLDASEGENAKPYQDGRQAYQHLIHATSRKFDETCIEASFAKEVEKSSSSAWAPRVAGNHTFTCWRWCARRRTERASSASAMSVEGYW